MRISLSMLMLLFLLLNAGLGIEPSQLRRLIQQPVALVSGLAAKAARSQRIGDESKRIMEAASTVAGRDAYSPSDASAVRSTLHCAINNALASKEMSAKPC